MKNAFIILNHSLTRLQEEELRSKFGVERIVEMPQDLKRVWSDFSAWTNLTDSRVSDIVEWLDDQARTADLVVVQGEWGATFYVVDFCFYKDLIPLYASSERLYEQENLSGQRVRRTHIFKHVKFKKYLRYQEIVGGQYG